MDIFDTFTQYGLQSSNMTNVNTKLENLLRESRGRRDVEVQTVTGGFDFYRTQLADVVLHLLLGTREYQDKAVSYRGFNVAAGAVALKGLRIGRFFGNNVKVDDTDLINIHAEDIAIGKAADEHYQAVSVVSVIGPTQEDHGSGLHTKTLHPCGRCRDRLEAHPLISNDTLFVTANPDFKVIEFASLGGIKKLHDENDPSGMTTIELHESEELFTPLIELEARTEITEAQDDEWQEKVGVYLLQRYIDLSNGSGELQSST